MTINKSNAVEVVKELLRRKSSALLFESAFKEQKLFCEDKSRLKAALTDRRSGKSYAAGLCLYDSALKNAGTKQIFIALTRESAKDILWTDVIKVIDSKFHLNSKFNESELKVYLPNGSTIKLMGIDASADQQEKILGQKFKRMVIDEAASYSIDLARFINKTARRCLTDYRGDLIVIGTPGNIKNYFYDITEKTTNKDGYLNAPGWSVHKWLSTDNPHVKEQIEEEIKDLIAANPNVVKTPWFQQDYMGQWVTDDAFLCYYGFDNKNLVYELPDMSDWVFILGIDLGYSPDPSSLSFLGYDPEGDGTLYILESTKKLELDVNDVAEWIRDYRFTYGAKSFAPHIMVIDEQKMIAETIKSRYHLNIEAAQKRGKAEHIALMNADLILNKIKVYAPKCSDLIPEWQDLIWNERLLPLRKEKDGLANHCFVAGTMIETMRGSVPIEQVTTDDYAMTRKGWRKVKVATPTGIHPTYRLTTSLGKEIVGTGNHPIFANENWVELSALIPGHILVCRQEYQQCQNTLSVRAKYVATPSNQKLMEPSVVETHVMQNTGEIGDLITKLGFASSAQTHLPVTSTPHNHVAQDHVLTVNATELREQVYNLSVDGEPEYFANGILVHNCADSALYAWMRATNYNARPATNIFKGPARTEEEIDEQFWDIEQKDDDDYT